jgi:hypothetical protein
MVARMPDTDPVPEPVNEHFHTEQQWELVLCDSAAIVLDESPIIMKKKNVRAFICRALYKTTASIIGLKF